MNLRSLRAAGVLLVLLLATPLAAQDQIVVDAAAPIAAVSRRPIGINVNFLLDDDGNRREALASLAQALKAAGVKYLRYPGGEKADGYLWSLPPYTRSIPTLARWAAGEWPDNQEWPSYDRALVLPDGHTFRTDPLDFDEFMAVCREIDCVPTIVVCYDSMYKPAQPGGVAPTRAQLLETAREWVRHANVVRGYGIKYWEIGNETWQPHYNGGATAEDYARDLTEFSQVMKSVDPTIAIGANGDSVEWWRTVLAGAASAIDFLAVHNYPAYEWGSYLRYRDTDVRLTDAVGRARQAIAAYAPGHASRLEIAVTETGPADWSGLWPHVNDLGHALVVFDILGQHLVAPDIAFSQFWNTRWSGNDTADVPRVLDAFDSRNTLLATGRVLAIWRQFLKSSMVRSTSTSRVRSYATYSPADGTLAVFLVNKDTQARDAVIQIDNLGAAALSVERWVFRGSGPDDVQPTWGMASPLAPNGNRIAARLDPVSVTVLDVRSAVSKVAVPGTIEAEDFDSFLDWTPQNHGGEYRQTAVDIERSMDASGGYNVGWFDPGEWLEYVIAVPGGATYQRSARVASPIAGATLHMTIDGAPAGVLSVPDTGSWQSWATVRWPDVFIASGTHRIRVSRSTGGLNLNWIAVAPGGPSSPVSRIEAEDFNTFLDWTAGNNGGQYRSTAVDIETCRDSGGGFNVGWFDPGEWLEYVIEVETAGSYRIAVRVASPLDGKTLRVTVGGVSAALNVPDTGGWQAWQTITTGAIALPSGTHRVRVATATGGLNVNYLELRR